MHTNNEEPEVIEGQVDEVQVKAESNPYAPARGDQDSAIEMQVNAMTAAAVEKVRVPYLMARQPDQKRNVHAVRRSLLDDAGQFDFADEAVGEIKFGSEPTVYPTIRFAEAIFNYWGNAEVETEVVGERPADRDVKITVVDYERNVKFSDTVPISKRGERKFVKQGQKTYGKRINSYGDPVFTVDLAENEILGKTQSQKSKLMRGSILRMVPKWIWGPAYEKCLKTLDEKTNADPRAAITKIVDGAATIGVGVADIEDYLGFKLEKATTADINRLRATMNAVKDGAAVWAEVLAEAVESRKKKPAGEKPKQAPAPTPMKQAERKASAAPPAAPAKAAEPAKKAAPPPAAPKQEDEAEIEGTAPLPFGEPTKVPVLSEDEKKAKDVLWQKLFRIKRDRTDPRADLCGKLFSEWCVREGVEITKSGQLSMNALRDIEAILESPGEVEG